VGDSPEVPGRCASWALTTNRLGLRNDFAIFSHRRGGGAEADPDHRAAHGEGSSQDPKGQPLLVGQGAHARRWPDLRQGRPVDPLRRDRPDPVDEVAPAPVDERMVVAAGAGQAKDVLAGEQRLRRDHHIETVIMVHRYTSVYIKRNEVELRLGTNIEVHARSIKLAYS
jgi:hypothetical protein